MGSDASDAAPKAMVPVRRGRALPVAIPTRVDDDPPPSVRGPAAPARPRVVGARNPAETGMLVMTPVGDNRGAAPSPDDPSATRFFALPPPPTAPSPRAASAAAPSPAIAPTPVIPVITGPVASAATPFPSTRAPQAPPSESRVESWRVAAVVVGIIFLAGLFALTATALILFRPSSTPVPTLTPVATTIAAPVPPPETIAPAVVDVPVVTQTRPRPTKVTTTPVAPVVVATPAATTGSVNISFSGETMPTGVEVVCAGEGFRERKSLSGTRVSIPNVPVGAACQAVPKGVPSSNFPVKAGGSYSCAVVGTTTTCN